MNNNYIDIRSKINEEPQWYDEHAVPRYCEFTPNEAANIYASEVALVLIKCQNCGKQFKVAFSRSKFGIKEMLWENFYHKPRPTIKEQIINKTLHYGDPPNTDCCPAGVTEGCIDISVLEYYNKVDMEWVREKDLDIDLEGQDND